MTTADWEPAARNHGTCIQDELEHAYIMVLLGFGSGCSVLSQFFDGATEAPQSRRPSTFLHKTQSAVSADWVFACWEISRQG